VQTPRGDKPAFSPDDISGTRLAVTTVDQTPPVPQPPEGEKEFEGKGGTTVKNHSSGGVLKIRI